MCCIFTCCGWMIDLIQRAWTFSMSCIIMSAVGGVMVTSSMSGIALGYNYSLAEYIDLKETNVSVYLKRGVFDDEIADDMDWRRAGHLPVQGQLKDENLRTGAPEDDGTTTLRSGRRLDDSVFEADDQNKYEGSLMKLTAKPLHLELKPMATDDMEMANTLTTFSLEPLDQMKAIQSLIDSRRAMATGGTTLSPLATYEPAGPILPYLPSNNNPNIQNMLPEDQYRRMMAPGPGSMHITRSPLNPARVAVPDPANLLSEVNWLGPKQPAIFVQSELPEFFIKSPTYPRPVTVAPAIIRPTESTELEGRRSQGGIGFPYPFTPLKPTPTPPSPTGQAKLDEMDKQPDFYNEKILAEGNQFSKNENNIPPKWGIKSPEEEYEDEIKGLPVRKRRSISTLGRDKRNPTAKNIIHPDDNKSPRSIGILSLVKNYFKTVMQTTNNEEDSNFSNNITTDKNQSLVKENNDLQIETNDSQIYNNDLPIDNNDSLIDNNDSLINNNDSLIDNKDSEIKISDEDITKQQMDINKKRESDLVSIANIISERDLREDKTGKSLLDYLVTSIRTKEAALAAETTPKADVNTSTAKKIRIKTRRKSFESKIVSSKYVTNNLEKWLKKKQPFSNQEILNSISVGLNEAGLLKNPESSPLVKLLQATLTA